MNFQFKRKEKGWYLFVTIDLFKPIWKSDERNGYIGIDINNNHLAISRIDRFGNPTTKKTIPLCLYGKNSNQANALIGDAVKNAVEEAVLMNVPIAIEKLDFRKKKNILKEYKGKKYKRILSSFT